MIDRKQVDLNIIVGKDELECLREHQVKKYLEDRVDNFFKEKYEWNWVIEWIDFKPFYKSDSYNLCFPCLVHLKREVSPLLEVVWDKPNKEKPWLGRKSRKGYVWK